MRGVASGAVSGWAWHAEQNCLRMWHAALRRAACRSRTPADQAPTTYGCAFTSTPCRAASPQQRRPWGFYGAPLRGRHGPLLGRGVLEGELPQCHAPGICRFPATIWLCASRCSGCATSIHREVTPRAWGHIDAITSLQCTARSGADPKASGSVVAPPWHRRVKPLRCLFSCPLLSPSGP